MVENGNFSLLLTSSGQEWQFHIATDTSGQEWHQFPTATDIYWSRMAISHCYWHLVVNSGNFTLLLMSSGSRMAISHYYLTSSSQDWQFHTATDIYWTRMAISRYLVVKEWQFHIAYWHLVVKNGNFTLLLTSIVKNGNFTLLLTPTGQEWQFNIATDI